MMNNNLENETTNQRMTLEQLRKKARKKYGNEIDIDEIYDILSCDVFNALNLVFCYGNPDCFGHGGFEFSDEELNLMVLHIIESAIDDKEELIDIQNPENYDASSDCSLEDYLGLYNNLYLKVLEQIHNLRNDFEIIKGYDPEDYPDWVDDWNLCFAVDVAERHKQNINTKSKKKVDHKINFTMYVFTMIDCLTGRCSDLIKKYEEEREKGKFTQTHPEQNPPTFH